MIQRKLKLIKNITYNNKYPYLCKSSNIHIHKRKKYSHNPEQQVASLQRTKIDRSNERTNKQTNKKERKTYHEHRTRHFNVTSPSYLDFLRKVVAPRVKNSLPLFPSPPPNPSSSLPLRADKGKEKLTDTEGWHETREENTHERNNGRVWMERWHASGPHPSIPKQNARTYQSSYEQLLCVMEGVPGVTY